MNEQQFLELSDRERDAFIEKVVFKRIACGQWEERNLGSAGGPVFFKGECEHKPEECYPASEIEIIHGLLGGPGQYTTDWRGLGLGIEHANGNGFTFMFVQWGEKNWKVEIFGKLNRPIAPADHKNIFLAFWIAYMKALGVISEKTG